MKKFAVPAVLSAALLAGCAGAPSAGAPTVTATATTTVTAAAAATKSPSPKATPSPSPTSFSVKISGNYGADLAAAGIIPDSVPSYGQFMKENLCDEPLTPHTFWKDRSEFSESLRTLASAAPDDVAAVRLSVAYFCPERQALAEAALKDHGYIK